MSNSLFLYFYTSLWNLRSSKTSLCNQFGFQNAPLFPVTGSFVPVLSESTFGSPFSWIVFSYTTQLLTPETWCHSWVPSSPSASHPYPFTFARKPAILSFLPSRHVHLLLSVYCRVCVIITSCSHSHESFLTLPRLSHRCPQCHFLHSSWSDLKASGRPCHSMLKHSKARTMEVHSFPWLTKLPPAAPASPQAPGSLVYCTSAPRYYISVLLPDPSDFLHGVPFLECSPFHSCLDYFLSTLQMPMSFPDLGKVSPSPCFTLSFALMTCPAQWEEELWQGWHFPGWYLSQFIIKYSFMSYFLSICLPHKWKEWVYFILWCIANNNC